MSNLKPGKTYVYENENGIVYANEKGSSNDQRFEIGRTPVALENELKEAKLWGNIHRAAKSNPALQEALNRVKIIYELSKDHGKK